ncbi:DNA topoisomerase I, mitochondrial-like [Ostrea edulis]|uniref:DNA topoisomerase I, mitochondrial-like n=1 Tax=Ostrea edulis TaxID=37623 RepID=UPI0024AFB716|nr:DNA topoisomerase I, mitochondrial-like [Ostrea edulis]
MDLNDDESSVNQEPVVSPGAHDKVVDLKAKMVSSEMSHANHAEQNGHATLPMTKDEDRHKSSKHSSSSKHGHSSSSSKHSSSSSNKHHSSSSSSSKHRDSSSSSSHKHKDKDRSSSSSKDKSLSSKHSSSSHKSSSSSGHKEGSSSSHREGSSKDKSSSSSKDRSSSSHKEGSSKHSSSSSHKHSSSSGKHKDGSSSKHSSSSEQKHKEKLKEEVEKVKVKTEPTSPVKTSGKEKSPSRSPSKRDSSPSKRDSSPTKRDSSPSKRQSNSIKSVKEEEMSDDEIPLATRIKKEQPTEKRRHESDDDDDDEPLSARIEKEKKKIKKEVKVEKSSPKKRKQDDSDDDFPKKKKKKVKPESGKQEKKSVTKKGVKEEETHEVWRWWEEERREDGVKWTFLEHKGPLFAPDYEPLPDDIRFYYDGKVFKLSESAEEVATFYAKMLEHDYTTKDVFNSNFLKDWRKTMTSKEKDLIKDLKKCNFKELAEYFKLKSEERKNRSKEEKKAEKLKNDEIQKEYGFCLMDGHKEKIGNFKIEPPGLFRGRGDHPKQGMLKTRTLPEDVIINCSKTAKIPSPPPGHKWKEVRHDNKVSWLACWNENIQGSTKYVMLNAASRLKGEKDWQKYETARRLHKCVDKIRATYREDWKSKEMRIRQRAVALYFIDKLALRAGNEKEEGETADTVGCCSLRREHLTLHEKYDDKEYVVEFDFLGKDSIRYYNRIPVEKRVFKNLQLFMENKAGEDDVFDRLNTTILNKHLHDLMDGLTAKVFRTYNASRTLQEQLNILTEAEDGMAAKLLSYNRANRAVAILCNHQRAAPKNFSKQMENLQNKIEDKKTAIKEAKKNVKDAKVDYKATKTEKAKQALTKRKAQLERLEEQLTKLEVQATDKEENKEIALGTSKLNYLDPRISVAWCKKWEVPVEKIYNKTQREKFRWAIDMAEADFEF